MKKSSVELENTHSNQMAEALDNLNTLTEAHKAEMVSALHAAQLKCKPSTSHSLFTPLCYAIVREQVADKERELEEKATEVKTLQLEKAELERMRHTDTVKLRLEVSK